MGARAVASFLVPAPPSAASSSTCRISAPAFPLNTFLACSNVSIESTKLVPANREAPASGSPSRNTSCSLMVVRSAPTVNWRMVPPSSSLFQRLRNISDLPELEHADERQQAFKSGHLNSRG